MHVPYIIVVGKNGYHVSNKLHLHISSFYVKIELHLQNYFALLARLVATYVCKGLNISKTQP